LPVAQSGGGYRDPGYRAAAPPKHALQIPIEDRGLLQVLSAIKNVTLDWRWPMAETGHEDQFRRQSRAAVIGSVKGPLRQNNSGCR
jgi:hypothetical protein